MINKQSISNFSATIIGGREVSINETNCDHCPVDPSPSGDDGGGRSAAILCSFLCYTRRGCL